MTAAAIVDALTPTPPGVAASTFGTAGTTAEPRQVGAHVDDRVNPLAGGTPGPAVQSQGRWATWNERGLR